MRAESRVAVGETVILRHRPLPLVGDSIAMERERQQNDSLADSQSREQRTEGVDGIVHDDLKMTGIKTVPLP